MLAMSRSSAADSSALTASDLSVARAAFLESADVERAARSGIPWDIIESWQRSLTARVDPLSRQVDWHETDPEHLLMRCARGPVQQLVDALQGMEVGAVVSEHRSRIVARAETDAAAGRLLDAISLAPGFDYSEGSIGTNGVGTALSTRRPVYITGSGHFQERFGGYACAGAPIHHPLTGEFMGVIDLTCSVRNTSPLLLSLAAQTAAQISEELRRDATRLERFALDAFAEVVAGAGERAAVLVAAGDVRLQTRAARLLLDEDEQDLLLQQGEEHAAFAEETEFSFESLRSGRSLRVVSRRLDSGRFGERRGVLLMVDADPSWAPRAVGGSRGSQAARPGSGFAGSELERAAGAAAPVHVDADASAEHTATQWPAGPPAHGRLMKSSAWRLARRELASILRRGETAAVLGEVGTGKASLVREVIASEHRGASLLEIDAKLPSRGGSLVDEVARALADRPRALPTETERIFLMLRNTQAFSLPRLREIAALLRRPHVAGRRIAVVLTADAQSADAPELQELLPYVDYAVAVPPLRERGADFDLIAEQLLERTGARLALSREAMRALAEGHWPGNFTQLADALAHAADLARKRGGTSITRADLPSYAYYAGRRTLTHIEREERNTIAAALYRHGGNRSAAAHYLGLSRATLYRKLALYELNQI